jgi:TolB protein
VETHDISEDGEWIAYDTNLHGEADIYLQRLSGGAPIPFVTGPSPAFAPRWSPDGQEIAWYGGETSTVHVASLDAGKPSRLGRTIGVGELPIWSPDGLSLAFRAPGSGHLEAWIATRERIGGSWGSARQLTNFGCAYQVWARDGSGLLCGTPGQTILTLISPSGAVVWQRDLAPSGLQRLGPAALSPDGAILYFRAARDRQAGIWALPLQGGEPRLIVTYEDPALQVLSYPGTINVTADRLYLTVAEFESDIWVMELSARR